MLSVAIVAALVAAVGGGLVMGAVMLVSWLLAAAVSMGTSIGVGAGSSRTAAGVFGQLAVLLLPALLLGAVSVLIYETGTLHFTRHTMGGGDIAGQLPWMLYEGRRLAAGQECAAASCRGIGNSRPISGSTIMPVPEAMIAMATPWLSAK